MTEEEIRAEIASEILDMEFPEVARHSYNVRHMVNQIIFEIAMRVADGPEKIDP